MTFKEFKKQASLGGSKKKKESKKVETMPSEVADWFEANDDQDLTLEDASELIKEMIHQEYGIDTPGPHMVKELF